jgi:hypothetical protein
MNKVSVILLSLIFSVFSAQATDYYFSTTGSDNNSGTSINSPYQTIGKVNAIFPNLAAGDRILFKRGETFYGSLITTKSGTSASPITLGAYGTGAKPVITGFTTVTGWTLIDAIKGIYESNTFTVGTGVNMITINGVEYAKGRYPNMNNGNNGYLMYESHTTNSITDNQSTIDTSWQHADVVIRTTHGSLEISNITGISGKTISFDNTDLGYQLSANNYGYFIQNDIKTLDQFGEWYYNAATNKLDVCFGNNNPSLYVVKSGSIDKVIQTRSSFLTVRDITVTGANSYAVWNDWVGVSDLKFTNCTFSYNGIDAILFAGKINVTIDSCLFDHNNSNAISVGANNENVIVSNTTISNTGLLNGMLIKDDYKRYGFGIYSSSPVNKVGLTCINNIIKNTGYIGVYFAGDNNLIKYNYVDSVCLLLDDGSGIYTYNYAPTGTPGVNVNNQVLYNIVDHSLGEPEGTEGNNMAHAYYCDDYTNNIRFIGNTGVNSGYSGIYFHNTNNYIVQNNIFYNNAVQMYWQDDKSVSYTFNGDLQQNQLFANAASQYIFYMGSVNNNFSTYGLTDNNYYCSPFKENQIAHTNWFSHSDTYYDLTSWQNTYHKDLNTKKTPVTITDAANVFFQYNATNSPVTVSLNGKYIGLDHTVYNTGSVIIQPFSSVLLIKISSIVPKKKKYNPFKGRFRRLF